MPEEPLILDQDGIYRVAEQVSGQAPILTVGNIVDDFEDGDTNVLSPNWSGWSVTTIGAGGGTASIAASSSSPIRGAFSGLISAPGGNGGLFEATRNSPVQAEEVSIVAEPNETQFGPGPGYETAFGFTILAGDTGSEIFRVTFDDHDPAGPRIEVSRTINVGSWTDGDVFEITVNNFDYVNETYDMSIIGTGGQDIQQSLSFDNPGGNIDTLRTEVRSEQVQHPSQKFDNVYVVEP